MLQTHLHLLIPVGLQGLELGHAPNAVASVRSGPEHHVWVAGDHVADHEPLCGCACACVRDRVGIKASNKSEPIRARADLSQVHAFQQNKLGWVMLLYFFVRAHRDIQIVSAQWHSDSGKDQFCLIIRIGNLAAHQGEHEHSFIRGLAVAPAAVEIQAPERLVANAFV